MHIESYDRVHSALDSRGRTYYTDGRMLVGVWGCSGNNSGYRYVGLTKQADANLMELFLSIPGVYSVELDEKRVEVWIREGESWDPIHAKLEELITEMIPMPDPPPWR